MKEIKVFGADWCHDTVNTLEHLDELGLAYQYINVDEDPAGQKWVVEQNDGKQKTPTVDVGGTILSVPSNDELDEALEAAR